MDPEQTKVEIDKRNLDFLPEVAQRIAIKLSFGYDDVETWNVYGAPTSEQQLFYLKEFMAETELHDKQIKCLTDWMDSVRVLVDGVVK